MNPWYKFYIFWGAIFLIVELVAIFRKEKNDTFSELVWNVGGVRGKGRLINTRRFVLITLMVWLTVHFITGGWV